MDLIRRPRRLRATRQLRGMVRETRVSPDSLILPFFVREGKGIREELESMPGQIRYSPDTLHEGVALARERGVNAFLLFGVPEHKDETGSSAWADDGVVQRAIRDIRPKFPDAVIITDVCMCEYTSHGHCGIIEGDCVHNDKTVEVLAKASVSHMRAGADMVAPSDMMDGRVAAIRAALDAEGFAEAPIMSYAVKYASYYYGPFRDAAGSAPGFGDRRGYQMDWHNRREGLREAALDLDEGADMLIVKPAMSYGDIISDVAAMSDVPVAAYSVSGEYSMIKAAAAQGMIDGYGIMCESAVGVYRAGADILISYFAMELAEAMRKGDIG